MVNVVQATLMSVLAVSLLAMFLGFFGTIALDVGSPLQAWSAYPAVFGMLVAALVAGVWMVVSPLLDA